MIPKECKRLAEVDFPIVPVSVFSGREKVLRRGHPAALHLWWARRPLASCRAMLLALLLPDPCDPLCPPEFLRRAGEIFDQRGYHVDEKDQLRQALLQFLGEAANWEVANDAHWISTFRDLISTASPEENPLLVDSFAGGGSIPLEGLRLGLRTFASDLNPIACLINQVLLQDIPRQGSRLVGDMQRMGAWLMDAVRQDLAVYYPTDPVGGRPTGYLWARTVRCEDPCCRAEIPLVSSFWVRRTPPRPQALRPAIVRPPDAPPRIEFEVFQPATEREVPPPTVSRARATCLACGAVLPAERVKEQLQEQRGGADPIFDHQLRRQGGATLLAVIVHGADRVGRDCRPATVRDYEAIALAQQRLRERMNQSRSELSLVPDEPLPPIGTPGFRVQRYGILQWSDLFTARQKLALVTLMAKIQEVQTLHGPSDGSTLRLMAFAFDSYVRSCNANARLRPDASTAPAFGMQTLPITWTFPETIPWGTRTENFEGCLGAIQEILKTQTLWFGEIGEVQQADACQLPLPDQSAALWFTDPPYYDAIPYADLSDFFLVWLQRILGGASRPGDPFDKTNLLSPKSQEAVKDRTKLVNGKPKDRAFFEETMGRAFAEGRRILRDDGIGAVVFAHKTTEGWEAFLSALIRSGWIITGAWPISTERAGRLRARDSAALATSVHLICRPRPRDAAVGRWIDIHGELSERTRQRMDRLEAEGVHGADLAFACLGPALELYSRFSSVTAATGEVISFEDYLQRVWEVVGRTALERVLGSAVLLEDDARLTALVLWTLQETDARNPRQSEEGEFEAGADEDSTPPVKGFALPLEAVKRVAQPLGIVVDNWEGRILQISKGGVRLLSLMERVEQLLTAEHSLGGVTSTLDRVHAAMLLQTHGRTREMRILVKEEQERGPQFLRLANALAGLYPEGSEERRLVQVVLLAMPRSP